MFATVPYIFAMLVVSVIVLFVAERKAEGLGVCPHPILEEYPVQVQKSYKRWTRVAFLAQVAFLLGVVALAALFVIVAIGTIPSY
jgi:hypothetical protein